jgi:hypothetical protein
MLPNPGPAPPATRLDLTTGPIRPRPTDMGTSEPGAIRANTMSTRRHSTPSIDKQRYLTIMPPLSVDPGLSPPRAGPRPSSRRSLPPWAWNRAAGSPATRGIPDTTTRPRRSGVPGGQCVEVPKPPRLPAETPRDDHGYQRIAPPHLPDQGPVAGGAPGQGHPRSAPAPPSDLPRRPAPVSRKWSTWPASYAASRT